MPAGPVPLVSVVLPIRNEEKYIEECVRSILGQTYPPDEMELLFVDGMSTDSTCEILDRLAQEAPQIRVLKNPDRTVPFAMNLGILNSRGKYIVRLDAHTQYPPTYIAQCLAALEGHDCENAGGIVVTKGRGYMGTAIAGALSSFFGVGNSHFRLGSHSGYVDTVPFGTFRRELFDRIGLYDERLTRNQDNELNYRIRKSGGKIYLDTDISCTYYCRDTLRGIMKMGFQNGTWNILTSYLCPGSMRMRHFVPMLFVLFIFLMPLLAALTGFSLLWVIYAFIWGAYLMLDAFYSYTVAEKQGMKYLPVLPIIFPAFHVAYGLGSLRGLLKIPSFRAGREKKGGKGP